MMDGDLQHPPAMIPDMIARWKEGYDIVYTVREENEGASLFKKFSSASFYGLINNLVDTHIVPHAADFRLMDRKALDCLNSLRERNRFIRGLVSWIGFKQYAMPYTAAKRFSGVTKYSFGKMFAFAVDGIASFSTLPLRFSAAIGFVAALTGLPYAIWAIYLKLFTDESVSGWASMVVAVLFLGGVQLMTLGVIGEYIGRIYEEVKDRPLYIASETLGFDQTRQANLAEQRDGNSHKEKSHRELEPLESEFSSLPAEKS
jgi:dolichol-phosphate mannosyltransferase